MRAGLRRALRVGDEQPYQTVLVTLLLHAQQARVRDCSDIPSALLVQMRGRDAICDAIRDSG